MQALEKEIALNRSNFEGDLQQRMATLDDRESVIAIREKEMANLQKEVESFPQRSEAAVKTAVNDATKHLTRDFESQQALIQARFEGFNDAFGQHSTWWGAHRSHRNRQEALSRIIQGLSPGQFS